MALALPELMIHELMTPFLVILSSSPVRLSAYLLARHRIIAPICPISIFENDTSAIERLSGVLRLVEERQAGRRVKGHSILHKRSACTGKITRNEESVYLRCRSGSDTQIIS